jgi:hypothetical protein
VNVTSAQLLGAAQQLRTTAGMADAATERHDAFGRSLGGAFGDVTHVWQSPAADRYVREGSGLASLASQVPAGMQVAAAALRTLASIAGSLADELAFHERALGTAQTTAAEVARARWSTPSDDKARLLSLDQRAATAAADEARARAAIADASGRWTAACRRAAISFQQATTQTATVLTPAAGGAGPQSMIDGGGAGTTSTGSSTPDHVNWGWSFVASPAIDAVRERGSTHILHLVAKEQPPQVLRAYEMSIVRRGHWRNPPALRSPNSPLHGTVRHPHWVRPVYGPARIVERGSLPHAPQMRDVAQRVRLPSDAWSRSAKVLGPVGTVGTIGLVGYGEITAVTARDDLGTAQKVANVGTTVVVEGGLTVGGGVAGAKGGAIAGAALGTMIAPGIGTAVGGVVGAVGGGIAGSKMGQAVGRAASGFAKRFWNG